MRPRATTRATRRARKPRAMLLRVALRALRQDLRATVASAVALALAAATVALFACLATATPEALARAVRAMGPAAVVHPRAGHTDEASWRQARHAAEAHDARWVRVRVFAARVRGLPVAVLSAAPDSLKALTPYWRVEGRRAWAPGEALAGARLAERFGLEVGGMVSLTTATGEALSFTVVGVAETGDEDDEHLYIAGSLGEPSSEYAWLGGERGDASGALRRDLEALGFEIEPLARFAHGEQTLLRRVRLLSGLTLAVVLALVAVAVAAAASGQVWERRRELAVLRALGARRREIFALLATEAVAVGAAAAVVGVGAGVLAARAVERDVLGLVLPAGAWPLAAAFGVAVGLAFAATIVAARRVETMDPALWLRGD